METLVITDNIKIKNKWSFLGIKNIFKDIKEMPKMYHWSFLIFGIISFILSFVDINHFINSSTDKSIWTIVNQLNTKKEFLGSMPQWINAILYCLSGLSSFTGLINVFLVVFGKISNFFWGALNNIITGLFTFDYGYIGDTQLNLLIYLPFEIIGWILWEQSMNNNKTDSNRVNSRKTSSNYVIPILFCIIAVLVIGWFYEIIWIYPLTTGGPYSYSTQIVPHLLDSIENACGILGIITQAFRLKEQWWMWVFVDVIMVFMYCGGNLIGADATNINININMVIETFILLWNGITGLLMWYGKLDVKTGYFVKKNSENVALFENEV